MLYSAYYQSLSVAKDNGLRSVAFPFISTGVYSYPLNMAAKVAVKAVWSFANQFPDVLDYVCWAVLDESTRQVYEMEIKEQKILNTEDTIIGFHLPTEPNGCFSNWYSARFKLVGYEYVSSEQYMMCQKVLLAREYGLADKIMHTADPAKAQEYAGAKYFTSFGTIKSIWDRNCKHIVKRGVRAKFAQNPELLEQLLNTGNALLCECAGKDRIWGIGINYNNPAWKMLITGMEAIILALS